MSAQPKYRVHRLGVVESELGGDEFIVDLTWFFESVRGIAIGRRVVFAAGPRGMEAGTMGPGTLLSTREDSWLGLGLVVTHGAAVGAIAGMLDDGNRVLPDADEDETKELGKDD